MIFNPVRTGKVTDDVCAIWAMMGNFYVVKTSAGYVAFDTGINSMLTKAQLKKAEINPDDVTHVFLTHSDYDHVGGLKVFKKAKIYLPEQEEGMVTFKKARMLFLIFNRRIRVYTTLKDREAVTVGDTVIKMISTPGHTFGSACYAVNDNILVTGDTLRLSKNGTVSQFFFVQNMNHSENKQSLEMLRNEGYLDGSRTLLSGHTGVRN